MGKSFQTLFLHLQQTKFSVCGKIKFSTTRLNMSLLNVSKHEPRKNHSTNKSTPRIQPIGSVTKKHKKIKLFFLILLAKKGTQNT